jgi:hypothetical protein
MYHLHTNKYMGIGNIYCDKHENGCLAALLLLQVNFWSERAAAAELAVAGPFR